MKTSILAAFALAGVSAPLALADDDYRAADYAVTQQAALDIAAEAGLDRLEEIEADDGQWEIEGHTAEGCDIELDIHGQSGDVLKREVDDCPPDGWNE